uniref:SCP domain-containing protein n=1 Tax=Ananas comosus var. bracteatus TaxID=296719 RepID=A0A6V7Q2Z3_ANACO|nr:unnamed protein product [Ananas comosus var. bracteatus]
MACIASTQTLESQIGKFEEKSERSTFHKQDGEPRALLLPPPHLVLLLLSASQYLNPPPPLPSVSSTSTSDYSSSARRQPADAAEPIQWRLQAGVLHERPGVLQEHGAGVLDGAQPHSRVGGATPLRWDQHLARYARRWTDQLRSNCTMEHSRGPYGENLFWAPGGTGRRPTWCSTGRRSTRSTTPPTTPARPDRSADTSPRSCGTTPSASAAPASSAPAAASSSPVITTRPQLGRGAALRARCARDCSVRSIVALELV